MVHRYEHPLNSNIMTMHCTNKTFIPLVFMQNIWLSSESQGDFHKKKKTHILETIFPRGQPNPEGVAGYKFSVIENPLRKGTKLT